MKKVSVFNCSIRKKNIQSGALPATYEFVREFTLGEDDVLCTGSYHNCREIMDRYHQSLVSRPEHFVVQWCDEFSFVVHQLVSLKRADEVNINSVPI